MRLFILGVLSVLMLGCSNNAGKKVPEFTAQTLSGKTISSSELKGKIVVIKIWATWCGSCISEIPQLNQLVEKYKNDTNVVFLAITDDKQEKIEAFLKRVPFDYQQIVDRKDIKLQFQPGMRKEIPKHMIVDQNLNIVFDESGDISNIAQALSEKIEVLKNN
jgi:peroxiredoxin